MHLGLTKSRDDKLLQDLLDKKLRVIVVFEDDYLNHIARIAYKDIQQDNYTYRIGEYNIYKGEEWGFCDFCKRHDCYFIVPSETIEGGSSEIPNDLEEAAVQAHIRLEEGGELSFLKIFEAGAKWQREQDRLEIANIKAKLWKDGFDDCKEQMMKKAVEIGTTEICWVPDGERVFPTFDPPVDDLLMPGIISQRFNEGDKVRVIVLPKED